MSKIKLSFSLETQDEHQMFDTLGVMINDKLFFHDDLGFKHTLIFKSNRVEYEKSGETSLSLLFEEKHTHPGTFQVMNHTLSINVFTEKLVIKPQSIVIQYRLVEHNETLHDATLTIDYSMLEEDKHGRN
jgi:hypothetical protein